MNNYPLIIIHYFRLPMRPTISAITAIIATTIKMPNPMPALKMPPITSQELKLLTSSSNKTG